MLDKLKDLYNTTLDHVHEFHDGTYPYEHYEYLYNTVVKNKPERILELGTAFGLTTIAMALGNKNAKIDTLDKQVSNTFLAKENTKIFNVNEQINYIDGLFVNTLPTLQSGIYDLVFFDGFHPSIEYSKHFFRLLKNNGLLISANSQLQGRTADKYHQDLNDTNKWQILDKFGDTVVARKLV